MAVMQAAAAIIGAIVIIAGLVGFFRSFWRPSPKRERDEDLPRNFPPGGINAIPDVSHHSPDVS
jgi:hypothetical protein